MVLAAFLLAADIALIAGWRWNSTPSLPLGLYKIEKGLQPVRGDVVSFCPSSPMPFMPPGPCNGVAPLMKEVVAVSGDVVEVAADQVLVNGAALPQSASIQRSEAFPGISIPHAYGRFNLSAGQLWVFGSGDPVRSFDSRYFGVVDSKDVLGVAKK